MSRSVGDRVGVLTDDGAVYGVYNGDLPCPLLGGVANPNITLDDGEVVWGCQVWWGPADKVRAMVESTRDAEEDAQ